MRVTVWVSRNVSVECEGSDDKSLFEAISAAQDHEFFAEKCCGKCGCEDIKFQTRTVKDKESGEENTFHELICCKCYAKLSFGHGKTGENAGKMYRKICETGPKGKAIKNEDGKSKLLPNKGWLKYNRETGKNE
jgi:ribosomal protein L40E